MTSSILAAMTLVWEKCGDVEDAADDGFGHEVLDEHFVNGFEADVGVERAAAELDKFVELALEGGVVPMGGVDLGFELGGNVADLLAVGLDGFVEILASLFFVVEVLGQQRGEILLLADVSAAGFVTILIKNSGNGVLEDDVVEGIADSLLVFDFGEEIVAAVFGFPEGEGALPLVDKRAIGADVASALPVRGVFVNQGQLAAASETGQERTEGAAHIAFGRLGLARAKFLDGAVVFRQVPVVRLDGDGRHCALPSSGWQGSIVAQFVGSLQILQFRLPPQPSRHDLRIGGNRRANQEQDAAPPDQIHQRIDIDSESRALAVAAHQQHIKVVFQRTVRASDFHRHLRIIIDPWSQPRDRAAIAKHGHRRDIHHAPIGCLRPQVVVITQRIIAAH